MTTVATQAFAEGLIAPSPAVHGGSALVRSSLVAIALGSVHRDVRDPVTIELVRYLPTMGGMSAAMLTALVLGTTGAGSDMDPLDLGPAHLALPATAAVGGLVCADECAVDAAAAVSFGVTVGARLRALAAAAQPGVGLHTASGFGIVAATAAAARALDLDPVQVELALCIGLDRAAGFAVNNNSTDVGATHFGWAAAHGVEAAWLANEGATASTDLIAALERVFPGQLRIDPNATRPEVDPLARTIFKAYPVNIYLNCLYGYLSSRDEPPIGPVEVRIPDIARLALPQPVSPRELRNTARGVAALALTDRPSYRTFTADRIAARREQILGAVSRVAVALDAQRSTALDTATIGVRYRDSARPQEAELTVARPGEWDQAGLAAFVEADLDAALLETILTGPPVDGMRGVAALAAQGSR